MLLALNQALVIGFQYKIEYVFDDVCVDLQRLAPDRESPEVL